MPLWALRGLRAHQVTFLGALSWFLHFFAAGWLELSGARVSRGLAAPNARAHKG